MDGLDGGKVLFCNFRSELSEITFFYGFMRAQLCVCCDEKSVKNDKLL
jgi:hypothetical protein